MPRYYVQPEPQTNYANLLLQGLGAYSQASNIQRGIQQDEEKATMDALALKAQTDPAAMAQLEALDYNRAAGIQTTAARREEMQKKQTYQTAAEMMGRGPQEQQLILQKHISALKSRGVDTTADEGMLLALQANDPKVFEDAQLVIEETVRKGTQTGFLKQPEQPKISPEAVLLRDAGIKPGSKEYAELLTGKLKRAGGPLVNVNTGENKLKLEWGKVDIKEYEKLKEKGDLHREAMQRLDVVDAIGLETGKGEPLKRGFVSWAKAAGADFSDLANVPKGEAYSSVTAKMVLDNVGLLKGSTTDREMDQVKETMPKNTNDPASNKFIINTAKAISGRVIEEADFYDRWREDHGGVTDYTTKMAWKKELPNRPFISLHYKTPEGLPIYYWQFRENSRRFTPGIPEEEILKNWRIKDSPGGINGR